MPGDIRSIEIQCFQDPLVVRREALIITLSTEAAFENDIIVQTHSYTLDKSSAHGEAITCTTPNYRISRARVDCKKG
jgi:hypothetical protein